MQARKVGIGCGVGVVMLVLLGIVVFVMFTWRLNTVSMTQEAFDRLTLGQERDSVEQAVGGSGLDRDMAVSPPPTPPGQECRYYVNKDDRALGMMLCYTDGTLATKLSFVLGGASPSPTP